MNPADLSRAVAAGVALASELGLPVDDASVLHDSNRVAVRLLPCEVLARVAPAAWEASARFEVDLARQLADVDAPVARLEPRVAPVVHGRDGFAITLWRYYEPQDAGAVPPSHYADALQRLHAGMRAIDAPVPRFTDRVASALRLVDDPASTPALADRDRELLGGVLRGVSDAILDRGAEEHVLHGEPHPGNLLATRDGLLFIDLETGCRGPVEFDLAHAPEAVAELYAGADHALERTCRILVLAMITTWRWDRDDEFPDGRRLGCEWLEQLRVAVERTTNPYGA